MISHCRYLVIVLVLWTTLPTSKASDDVVTTESPQENEAETSPFPEDDGYNNEVYNSGASGQKSGSNEGNSSESESSEESSNEKMASPKLSPMRRYNDDRYWIHRYHGYDGPYGSRRWNQPKWQNFEYSRWRSSHSDWRRYFLWPRQENRWNSPQDDQWNLLSTKCTKVDIEDIPDQPRGYSDQASRAHQRIRPIPGSMYQHMASNINVSAYDIYKEHCCSGKTYPKYPNGEYACCGSSDYDTLLEVCCEGRVYSQEGGYKCCGESYINTNLQICCYHPETGTVAKPWPDNALQSKETRLFSQCCGDELYDTRTHVCFLVTSNDDVSVNFTVIENKFNRTGCCKGKPYDQDNGTCDETGKVYTFVSGPPCVFKQAFELVQKLRQSQSSPRYGSYDWYEQRHRYRHPDFDRHRYDHHDNRFARCGSERYDPYTERCCVDRYGEQKNGTTAKVVKRMDGECCGTEVYNYARQKCCNGRVHDRPPHGRTGCCGQELYNFADQLCCQGSNTVVEARGNANACCGREGLPFNTSSHLCCNNSLAEIPKDNMYGRYHKWDCCGDKVYNSDRGKCCNGVVHNTNSYYYDCCGTELVHRYHGSTCCGGKVYKHRDMSCCNNEPYNPKSHTCCGGTVVESSSSHADSCCGKVPYDNQIQTCCLKEETNEWLVSYKRSRHESCCGGKAYDPERESCCGHSPGLVINAKKSLCCEQYNPENGNYTYAAVDKKPNATSSSCCGVMAYDRENEICCSNTILPNVNDTLTCCGTTTYHPSTQLCCYDKVHMRSDDDSIKCCGRKAYDVNKEICCHGVALPVKDVETAMCCYENNKLS